MATKISTSQVTSPINESLEKHQEIVLTYHGKPVAHLSTLNHSHERRDLRELTEFWDNMPKLRRPFVELLREMRDEEG